MPVPNLGLIGTFPPPWGGIEVHIRSLADTFVAEGATVVVLNTRARDGELPTPYPVLDLPVGPQRAWPIARITRQYRLRVLHAHIAAREWRLLIPLVAMRPFVRVCASFHSFHEGDERWTERALPHVVHRLDRVFASGPAVRDRLITRGVRAEQVTLLAPFVAPASVDPSLLSDEIRAFMARSGPIVTTGASLLYTLHGREVYGMDVIVRAFAMILGRFPQAGLVMHISRTSEPARLVELRALIDSLGASNNILLIDGPIEEPAALWANCDVFVRPSWDDGDSVAVRQALWARVPTIASNAVPRPDGVVLFRAGDHAGLAGALIDILSNPARARADLAALPVIDAAAVLRGVYHELSEGRWRG